MYRCTDLHFCSMCLISSGGIFILSMCSCKTLAHFCKDSITVQGLDISATKTTMVSCRDSAETANLSSPLWYKSPSRIQTLQRVWSERKRHIWNPADARLGFARLGVTRWEHECSMEGAAPATSRLCLLVSNRGSCVNAYISQKCFHFWVQNAFL